MNERVLSVSLFLCFTTISVMGCSKDKPLPPPVPSPSPPISQTVSHQLQVNHHAAIPISETEADQILGDGTNVIQTRNAPGDEPCDVELVRTGGIGTFPQPRFINSSADMDAAELLPGHVHVVDQINWCGGFSPNIIGCASVPGNSLVVVRFTPALEGILWLHEFGHNKGRNHRNDQNAVMAPSIGATRTHVSAAECAAFEAP